MKYASLTGIAAAILLIIFCFIPWAFYPDLKENFTGFYSHENVYGKPAKAFIFLSMLSILFFFITKLWAKRVNQFISVFIFAYAIKSYFIYSACYGGYCPQVKWGLYGILLFSLTILISSLLSKGEMKTEIVDNR